MVSFMHIKVLSRQTFQTWNANSCEAEAVMDQILDFTILSQSQNSVDKTKLYCEYGSREPDIHL